MIDIHNHILPALDDGPKTEEESIKLAMNALEQGINTVVATPHHNEHSYQNKKADIVKHVAILNELFQTYNIPLNVLVGQEVRINGNLVKELQNNDLATVNDSKFLLIEFPYKEIPYYTEKLIYDIQMAGYVPVIAHPERNAELRENHRRMYNLVRKGAITQITAASLLGKFGKEVEKFTHQLIEANLTHVIASDAHHSQARPFQLRQAMDSLKQKYGIDTYRMFMENSHLIIDNMHVNRLEPSQILTKRSWFFRR